MNYFKWATHENVPWNHGRVTIVLSALMNSFISIVHRPFIGVMNEDRPLCDRVGHCPPTEQHPVLAGTMRNAHAAHGAKDVQSSRRARSSAVRAGDS